MATGTVKKVVAERGFGFITGDDDGRDYFFHRSAVAASLDFDRMAGGEKVRFEIEQDAKGPRARNVEAA
jgi:CspA family cold shock protein